MSHALKADVVSDNRVGGSSGHKPRAGNVFSSCYLWPSLKGKQMALLLELFRSCFKWANSNQTRYSILSQGSCCIVWAGLFLPMLSPSLPQQNGQRRPRRLDSCLSPLMRLSNPGRMGPHLQQPGLLLVTPLSLGCGCIVGSPDLHSFSYLILSKA